MQVKEACSHKISFRLVKPGTLFQDNSGSFYIKTDEGDSFFVTTGHVLHTHSSTEMVIPYPNAIILPQGETK